MIASLQHQSGLHYANFSIFQDYQQINGMDSASTAAAAVVVSAAQPPSSAVPSSHQQQPPTSLENDVDSCKINQNRGENIDTFFSCLF